MAIIGDGSIVTVEKEKEIIEVIKRGITGSVGSVGPVGPSGLTMRGNWAVDLSYNKADLVSHNDGIWMCVMDNTGITPILGSEYWTNINSTTIVKRPGRPA